MSLFGNSFYQEKADQKTAINPIIAAFKTLWGNNGDFLSLQYAGHLCSSPESYENLPEKKDIVNRFNSVSKLFCGSVFEENFKNRCLNLFLQKDTSGIKIK